MMSDKKSTAPERDISHRMVQVIGDPKMSPELIARAVELIGTEAVLNDRIAQAKTQVDFETFLATVAAYSDVTAKVNEMVERCVSSGDLSGLKELLVSANSSLEDAIRELYKGVERTLAKRPR